MSVTKSTVFPGPERFFVCGCFFTHNIFLKKFKQHVTYFEDDKLFKSSWKEILMKKGCQNEEELDAALVQVKAEVERRKLRGSQLLERKEKISAGYKPLYPHLYTLQESYFAPEFLKIVEYCQSMSASSEGLVKRLTKEKANRVFSFPVFTAEFCDQFVEEIAHFENSTLPKGRPNTMNNYGVLLMELGFDINFLNPLRIDYLAPITSLLYPDVGGNSLDSHRAFVVKYKLGEDVDLNYHYDNAEVTINVSLGKEFSDGELYFGDMRQMPCNETRYTRFQHQKSIGLLHRGQHMHGAMPISDGERYNLIIWMRSSQQRNQLCPMCDEKPNLVESMGYGDGFTDKQRMEENNSSQETVEMCAAL
ncbi:2-oxoglutarate and iron-dependent oxygenase domain-containing protein 2-like [Lytechinus pictus]|uniref:2-oxoglutarate and iron-dependent oxygenase domain-containing protein 2-like n=1 Tax=Lytechinus pictus TaxID=7653 RepID=UPI00240D93DC|nr:2-oxoglutarate and iron-dependent oxygenase domain-containing protein 2-like [Lytechinus pictus]